MVKPVMTHEELMEKVKKSILDELNPPWIKPKAMVELSQEQKMELIRNIMDTQKEVLLALAKRWDA